MNHKLTFMWTDDACDHCGASPDDYDNLQAKSGSVREGRPLVTLCADCLEANKDELIRWLEEDLYSVLEMRAER